MMDDNIKSVLHKVVQLTRQNPEFNAELRKALEIAPPAMSVSIADERINQIYEYCIEQIIRRQASEFYADFPITSITPQLIADFVNMEFFRRKDDFGNFCIALYQQIENITNKLCENRNLSFIVDKMWAYPAYVKDGIINDRPESEYCIAKLIFPGENKKTGQPYYFEKSKGSLQTQYANDKIRIIIYFLGYRAAMKNSDYDSFKEITSIMNDIYQCRNMNHRGNTLTEWEEKTLNRILPMKSFCYFLYLGTLAQYIQFIKDGLNEFEQIYEYAKSLEDKKIKLEGPKVLYKIELSEEDKNKKRFNR
jgi:hypothetical protein